MNSTKQIMLKPSFSIIFGISLTVGALLAFYRHTISGWYEGILIAIGVFFFINGLMRKLIPRN